MSEKIKDMAEQLDAHGWIATTHHTRKGRLVRVYAHIEGKARLVAEGRGASTREAFSAAVAAAEASFS